jgi:hypothetical protein
MLILKLNAFKSNREVLYTCYLGQTSCFNPAGLPSLQLGLCFHKVAKIKQLELVAEKSLVKMFAGGVHKDVTYLFFFLLD